MITVCIILFICLSVIFGNFASLYFRCTYAGNFGRVHEGLLKQPLDAQLLQSQPSESICVAVKCLHSGMLFNNSGVFKFELA